MKRCPQCNFSFTDSHDTCDFDGAVLFDEPETLPVSPGVTALAATTQSRFLRMLKSPVFFTVLLVAGLLSSLMLIVYYGAKQPNTIAERRAQLASPASKTSPVPPTDTATQNSPSEVSTASYSSPPGRGWVRVPTRRDSDRVTRSVTPPRPRPRLRTSPSRNQQTRPEIAHQRQPKDKTLQKESKESALLRDSEENPNRKESKLTAALKTTWNILKKPFKF